jgi:multicomponent Na+:H+ antiporter subunit D
VSLDLDWFWRVGWVRLFRAFEGLMNGLREGVGGFVQGLLRRFSTELMRHHGAQGVLARAWPVGSMLLWVALLLAVFMILRYFPGA